MAVAVAGPGGWRGAEGVGGVGGRGKLQEGVVPTARPLGAAREAARLAAAVPPRRALGALEQVNRAACGAGAGTWDPGAWAPSILRLQAS